MKIKFSFFLIPIAIFIFLSGYFMPKALAAPFSGWLWGGSEDGTMLIPAGSSALGWIDMSKVSVDASGNLSGYGWSGGAGALSSDGGVGWIDFGGSGGGNCVIDNLPGDTDLAVGVCTPIVGKYCARKCDDGYGHIVGVTKSGNALTGWARVVGIAQESFYGNNGGWDGWINFNNYPAGNFGWNGENTTDPPLKLGNYANALGYIQEVPGNSLKICQGGCADNRPYPVVANLNPGDPITLKACFNTSAKCDSNNQGEDVTDSASWSDNPLNVVNSNGGKGQYKADLNAAGKNTLVTATYNNGIDHDTAKIYVSCVSDPSYCSLPDQANIRKITCKNSFFPDKCGSNTCKCTEGDCKDCTGWRELGP